VNDRSEAELRIGFLFDHDGSWSYVGRDVLQQGMNSRTMNFGWDLTSSPHGTSTALHEIGHTLGLPHEHQNPFAGIVWDEAKVYQYFTGPPNNWDRDKTFHNVLRKLDPAEVEGSVWDPDSIMEYAFRAGLIVEPAEYGTSGVHPPGTVSELDTDYVLRWYPTLGNEAPPTLQPFRSVPLSLKSGEQADFTLSPPPPVSTSSAPSARATRSSSCSRRSTVNCAMSPGTTTAARTAIPTSRPSSSRAVTTSCASASTPPGEPVRPPSCTGDHPPVTEHLDPLNASWSDSRIGQRT
jgi:hypothetical protein